jgi:hypothetical protein
MAKPVPRTPARRRGRPGWYFPVAAVALVLTSGYSTFLQFRVNCEGFFVVYDARVPIEGLSARPQLDSFWHRHAGLVVGDLVRCQGHPDDLPFFSALKQIAPAVRVEQYRHYLNNLLIQTNLYWWPPPQLPGS